MTTIACNAESMAGDGLASNGGLITDRAVRKVVKLDDGRLAGAAGRASDVAAFIAWLNGGAKAEDRPPTPKSLSALVLGPDGCTYWDEGLIATPQELPAAIGSGNVHALTAMDCGKSPVEAVRLAALRDTATGGAIYELRLGE